MKTGAAARRSTLLLATALSLASVPAGAGTSTVAPAIAPGGATDRLTGPAGCLVLVESSHALPLVRVAAVVRAGSGWDPHKKEGLASLAAAAARRGAAGASRVQLDARLDALGADLDVTVDPDSIRLEGHVLTRNLDAFLAILADVLLRPTFAPDEVARTRRDLLAQIDEASNDDTALGLRYFGRNLYGDHPYGYPPEGTRASLARVRRDDLRAFFKRHVVGSNVILAGSGDVTASDFAAAVKRHFDSLPVGPPTGSNPLAVREPQAPSGWRIQIVDKPDRQQAQIFFGQLGVPAADPDYVPLLVAAASFGGRGMKATLMDELRTKRSLAYGAYLTMSQRLGRGALTGWVEAATAKAVPTLKLALKLYVELMQKGLDAPRLTFAKNALAGTLTTDMDDPDARLDARLTAELAGLPPTFLDELPARVQATTLAQVNAAISRRVHAHDLAITVVATASVLRPLLLGDKVQPGAIDVVPYDTF